MKRHIILLLFVLCFGFTASAVNGIGNCISYTHDGRDVTFQLSDSAAIQLQFCSPSVIRIWYAPEGEFQRNNESFAVLNEEL